MSVKNLKDVQMFMEMTTTDKAIYFAETVKDEIKIIGSDKDFYRYEKKSKLWLCESKQQYMSYVADFFNNLGKTISEITKKLGGLVKNKEIAKLINLLDTTAFLTSIVERSSGRLQDNEFVKKLENTLKDHLPILNGKKINLRTKEISDREKTDYFSFELPVDYVTETPNANKFFSQIMPNKINRKFLQKCLGYTITGDTTAQVFFIMYGDGSNGKSVLLRLLRKILGKYYHTCGKGIFMKGDKKDPNAPSPEKVALIGSRIAVHCEGETADDIELNDGLLKEVSGEDEINARPLFRSPLTFRALCKLVMATNYKPHLEGDKSIKRRLIYLFLDSNFTEHVKNANDFLIDDEFIKQLETMFLSEVFSWIVNSSVNYYKRFNY